MSYAIVAGCVRLFLTLEDDDVIVTEAVCFGTPRLSARKQQNKHINGGNTGTSALQTINTTWDTKKTCSESNKLLVDVLTFRREKKSRAKNMTL